MSKFFKIKTLYVVSMLGFLIGVFLISSSVYQPIWQTAKVGETVSLSLNYPESLLEKIYVNLAEDANVFGMNTEDVAKVGAINLTDKSLTYQQSGKVNLSLRLFGIIPVKQINVDVYPQLYLYPGGQPVGILLRTEGIIVVGQSPVVDEYGKSRYPAEEAGIKAGDTIICINGEEVFRDDQMASLINEYGKQNKEIIVDLIRDEQQLEKKVIPIFCNNTNSYRIGLYVRDNAGGVGTLTFIDPSTKQYGALGHMISNNETQKKINILNGKLVQANIDGIKKGQRGYPGEKVGRFVSDLSLGSIIKNTSSGIFGKIEDMDITASNIYKEPLPVGGYSEIEVGEAEILTSIEGNKIESFSIQIEKVMLHGEDGKDMVIRVTDPFLLEKTGGIVQGMSGSPIIQNGKIIGAVTHVFINDPTKGYGIFIHEMLAETTLLGE